MQSHQKPAVAVAVALLACLLHGCEVRATALPWGSHPDRRPAHPPLLPRAEMAEALEYVESLQELEGPDDGGERFRPRGGQEVAGRGRAGPLEDHVSQQLLKTLLTTLQDPKLAAAAKDEGDIRKNPEAGDYGGYPFSKHGSQHKKYLVMLEEGDSRESPYKRTNENVEPQYTPQSLATLQSVFQDLGKLSTPQENEQHQAQEPHRGDRDLYPLELQRGDRNLYPFSDLAYEDLLGGGDWTSVEKKVETEEEIKDSREEFDRGLDNSEDDDDDDYDEDDDEDAYYGNDVKRSSQPAKYREKDDPDDFTKLVYYYLLKVLKKTEQRREEEDTERRSVQPPYDVDPKTMYQLREISQKLQVPPKDLVEMLQRGEMRKQKKLRAAEETDDLEREEEKLTQISRYIKDPGPVTKHHTRRLLEALANNLKILRLLGKEIKDRQRAKALRQQRKPTSTHAWFYAHGGRLGNGIPTTLSKSDHREDNYDEDEYKVYEDKLATYLAAKMVARYPEAMSEAVLKRAPQQPPHREEALEPFERPLQDHSERLADENSRQPERHPKTEDPPQTQHLNDKMLMRMLERLTPVTNESMERDLYGKNTG